MRVQHPWNITDVKPQLLREREKNLSIYHFIYYRFHMVWAENKTRVSVGEGQIELNLAH